MNLPDRNQRAYSLAQRRLLMFMERTRLDAGTCDQVMRDTFPWLPGWYASLMEQDIVTPLEQLTDNECEKVQRAIAKLCRRLGRRAG